MKYELVLIQERRRAKECEQRTASPSEGEDAT